MAQKEKSVTASSTVKLLAQFSYPSGIERRTGREKKECLMDGDKNILILEGKQSSNFFFKDNKIETNKSQENTRDAQCNCFLATD